MVIHCVSICEREKLQLIYDHLGLAEILNVIGEEQIVYVMNMME